MLYAWIFYGVCYAATSLLTLWAVGAGLGAENLGLGVLVAAGLQVLRALPSGGMFGMPGEVVRWLNYYAVLTLYRMNYL